LRGSKAGAEQLKIDDIMYMLVAGEIMLASREA
jgi:hypothetical protein